MRTWVYRRNGTTWAIELEYGFGDAEFGGRGRGVRLGMGDIGRQKESLESRVETD